MAEFLIFDKDHWMDSLTQGAIDAYGPKFKIKYAARNKRGDIIEVRPDGFWTGENARGFNQEAFRVVAVPGLSLEEAQKYAISGEDLSEKVLLKRRYRVNFGFDQKIAVKADKKIDLEDKTEKKIVEVKDV